MTIENVFKFLIPMGLMRAEFKQKFNIKCDKTVKVNVLETLTTVPDVIFKLDPIPKEKSLKMSWLITTVLIYSLGVSQPIKLQISVPDNFCQTRLDRDRNS